MYADDTLLYHSFSIDNYDTAKNNVNDNLKSLAEIAYKHSLSFNKKKQLQLFLAQRSTALV